MTRIYTVSYNPCIHTFILNIIYIENLFFFFKGEEDLCIKDRQKYKEVMDTAQTMDYKEEVWYRKTLAKS